MTNTLIQLSALIEAFLFAKGSPVSLTDMAKAVGEDSQMIEKALTLLSEKYEKPDSGLTLHHTGAGYMLATKKNMTLGSPPFWATDAALGCGAGDAGSGGLQRACDASRDREDPRRDGRPCAGAPHGKGPHRRKRTSGYPRTADPLWYDEAFPRLHRAFRCE